MYRHQAGSDPSLQGLHRHHSAGQANLSNVNDKTSDHGISRNPTSHNIALKSQLVFQDPVKELTILATVGSVDLKGWVNISV